MSLCDYSFINFVLKNWMWITALFWLAFIVGWESKKKHYEKPNTLNTRTKKIYDWWDK